jgi:hypothetical protein
MTLSEIADARIAEYVIERERLIASTAARVAAIDDMLEKIRAAQAALATPAAAQVLEHLKALDVVRNRDVTTVRLPERNPGG